MKKLLIVVLATGLLIPVGAQAQEADAGAEQVLEASASWVVRRAAGAGHFRFVEAFKAIDPVLGTDTIVDYGNVHCGIGADGRVIVTSCKVTTRIIFTRPERFHVDPLLRSATLKFVENGVTQTASWFSKENQPRPTWALHGDGEWLTLNAGLRSAAHVRGRVMGDRFSTKTHGGFATLKRGGSAQAFVDADDGYVKKVYEHRSRTRAGAWRWIRGLVRSQ